MTEIEESVDTNPVLGSKDSRSITSLHHTPRSNTSTASYHTPTRSQAASLNTTVPQNIVQEDLHSDTHTPVRPLKEKHKKYHLQCCTLPVCLVMLQVLLGATVTVFGFVMLNISPSLKVRDTPYWSGIPLIITGIIGLYFCATTLEAYSGSIKAFLVKASCFVTSAICIFIALTASAFTGIHGATIISFQDRCQHLNNQICQCSKIQDMTGLARVYIYEDTMDCENFLANLKTYLFFQCALNAIGGFTCFCVVIMLWKLRYMEFYSGLRFYSYSATIPNHP
ncbi:sarcospan-like [Saccoglossus kowalevskii]|uniref:Sarcospan-like n=1 Tax=Saccoglossus kowalevskii TaxID=10224 RepID=A0ABM0MH19_SACKO|nr:PREDICTED: sarcospan-like [Saccoglossus kowalevskii]